MGICVSSLRKSLAERPNMIARTGLNVLPPMDQMQMINVMSSPES